MSPSPAPPRPSLALSLLAAVSLLALWGWLQMSLFDNWVVPLTYVLPLLIGVWHRRRWLVWAMAAGCVALVAAKMIGDAEAFASESLRWTVAVTRLVNIGVAGAVIHAVIALLDRLEARNAALHAANQRIERQNEELHRSNGELEATNEELAAREEEISRQNEELRNQGEELEQQAGELESQAEELQGANDELVAREQMLQSLMGLAAVLTTQEGHLLDEVCRRGLPLLGKDVVGAAVLQPHQDGANIRVCAHVGVKTDGVERVEWPLERSLAGLVIHENRTAALDDMALRPDLIFPQADGARAFRTIVASPLRVGGKAVGAVEFYGLECRPWSQAQFRLAEWVAAQCSAALELVRLRSELQNNQQQLLALNATLEDRVARRTAEAQRRSEQLQALAAELTRAEERERRRLAQVLHDELQQMLAAAKMRVAMVQARVTDPKAAGALREVEALSSDAIALTRSLTTDLSPTVLRDGGLIGGLRWLARDMHQKHGLAVEIDAADGTEPESEEVRGFLYRAVRELVFNARKHAGCDRSSVRLSGGDGRVRLVVEDHGKGFDPETLRDRPASGGFGLFSLRERSEYLGGSMAIQSRPAQGTRVSLELPVRLSRPQSPAPTVQLIGLRPSGDGHAGGIRVLLADDHRIVREGFASILAQTPGIMVVGEAANGLEAVALARQLRPDVIVMDITMPQMTGIEATGRIMAELPRTKVVGLSMHEADDMAAAMRKAGAVAYLRKDGPAEELIRAIRSSVDAPV